MVYIGDMITHGSANLFFSEGRSPKWVIQEALSASLCTVLMGMLAQDGYRVVLTRWIPPGRMVDSMGFNGIL